MLNTFFIVIIFFQAINGKYIGDNVEYWHAKTNNDNIKIEVDEGYRILVNITNAIFHDFDEVDVNDLPEDPIGYAIIKDNKESLSKKDQLVIAHHISSSKAYVFNTNKLIGTFYSEKGSLDCTFQKFGDKITTTTEAPTTTESPFPTPPHNLTHTNYTNYVYGKPAEEYRNDTVVLIFKEAVAQMANEYCTHNTEIHLNQSVTSANVNVTYLIECPINWPETDVCVKVTFEVPVVLKDAKPNQYELTTPHLERMWELYADKYLNGSHSRNKDELSPYDVPNVDKIVTFWAIAIAVVILMLTVGVFVVRKLCSITDAARLPKSSDKHPIIKQMEPTDMMPHVFQDVPPFFEEAPKKQNGGPVPYMDDDDDSIADC